MPSPLPTTPTFVGVTVILPVVSETDALDETARALRKTSVDDVAEVLVVVCDRTTPASLGRRETPEAEFGDRLRIHHQGCPSSAEPCGRSSILPPPACLRSIRSAPSARTIWWSI